MDADVGQWGTDGEEDGGGEFGVAESVVVGEEEWDEAAAGVGRGARADTRRG